MNRKKEKERERERENECSPGRVLSSQPFKGPSPDSSLFTNRTVRGKGAKPVVLRSGKCWERVFYFSWGATLVNMGEREREKREDEHPNWVD